MCGFQDCERTDRQTDTSADSQTDKLIHWSQYFVSRGRSNQENQETQINKKYKKKHKTQSSVLWSEIVCRVLLCNLQWWLSGYQLLSLHLITVTSLCILDFQMVKGSCLKTVSLWANWLPIGFQWQWRGNAPCWVWLDIRLRWRYSKVWSQARGWLAVLCSILNDQDQVMFYTHCRLRDFESPTTALLFCFCVCTTWFDSNCLNLKRTELGRWSDLSTVNRMMDTRMPFARDYTKQHDGCPRRGNSSDGQISNKISLSNLTSFQISI